MENVSRRSFVGMGAGLAAMAGMATAGIANAEFALTSGDTTQVGDDDLAMFRTNTSLNELNAVRRQVIDACEDYVCSDGTVIDKIWVQVRALIDGLGAGTGAVNYNGDESFRVYQILCNENPELAKIYVNSPIGVRFTALDAAVCNGITEAEAKAALDELTFNGMFMRTTIDGLAFYQHQRTAHGITESSMNLYMNPEFIPTWLASMANADSLPFPAYYPMPLNKDVVIDESILPYDDIEALIERHSVFAVSPCQCRYLVGGGDDNLPHILDRDAVEAHVCADGTHLEKCLTFGEEAQFYIEQGIGRQITADEMREFVKRAADEGCVLQSCYTKYTEVICSCNGPCGVLAGHRALIQGTPDYANVSHYNLCYDKDICLKCGICVNRCPMEAVEMDADGYPAVTGPCIRCGQCAYVCPAEARKLAAKPAEEIPYLPNDLLDWINQDAMYRYEKGLWPAKA